MSRKFFAVNRKTGERWSKKKWCGGTRIVTHAYLVMYDSGYLAVVEEYGRYEKPTITQLDPKEWETVTKASIGQVPAGRLYSTLDSGPVEQYHQFTDRADQPCLINPSSLAGEAAIWFGPDSTEAKPMHLSQDQVTELLPMLLHFAEKGVLPVKSQPTSPTGRNVDHDQHLLNTALDQQATLYKRGRES